jgi:hypothetical protein
MELSKDYNSEDSDNNNDHVIVEEPHMLLKENEGISTILFKKKK